MQSTKPPLILIVGSTAIGKTELAIQLAERLEKRNFRKVYN